MFGQAPMQAALPCRLFVPVALLVLSANSLHDGASRASAVNGSGAAVLLEGSVGSSPNGHLSFRLPHLLSPTLKGMSVMVISSGFSGKFFILNIGPPKPVETLRPYPDVGDSLYDGFLMLVDIGGRFYWVEKPGGGKFNSVSGHEGFVFGVSVSGSGGKCKLVILVDYLWEALSADYDCTPFREFQVSSNLKVTHAELESTRDYVVVNSRGYSGKFFVIGINPSKPLTPWPDVGNSLYENMFMLVDIDGTFHWVEKPDLFASGQAGFVFTVKVSGSAGQCKLAIVVNDMWEALSVDYDCIYLRHKYISFSPNLLVTRLEWVRSGQVIEQTTQAVEHEKPAVECPATPIAADAGAIAADAGAVPAPEPEPARTDAHPRWVVSALLLLLGALFLYILARPVAEESTIICVHCSFCGRHIGGFANANDDTKVYVGLKGGGNCGEYRKLEDVWKAYGADGLAGEVVYCCVCDEARLNGKDYAGKKQDGGHDPDPDALFDDGLAEAARNVETISPSPDPQF